MVKNLPTSAGDAREVGLIPGSGRFPGVEYGNPLQYSCLENSMDRGGLVGTVHGVTGSDTTKTMDGRKKVDFGVGWSKLESWLFGVEWRNLG